MNIPTSQLIATHNYDSGLTIYNDEKSKNKFWKGVVVDDSTGKVVARSFQSSPTVIGESVPEDQVYTPMMEGMILRFYRHNDTPMISTHRNINIVGTKSRMGNGRFFYDLVRDAISGWENRTERFDMEDGKGIAYTPDNWEDLCVDGWCNVFLLVDDSNQKTDLIDTTKSTHPLLLYCMSLSNETDEMVPASTLPIWWIDDTSGSDIIGGSDDTVYNYVTWCLPTLPIMDKVQAEKVLANGGGVVGFKPESRDITVKYFSSIYHEKLSLTNDNTNIIHRWHELIDEDPTKATRYLSILPYSLKHMDEKYMRDTVSRYLDETCTYLTNVVVSRYTGNNIIMPEILERKAKIYVDTEIQRLKNKYSRGSRPPSKDKLCKVVKQSLTKTISTLPYTQQHRLHSLVQRDTIETSIANKNK